MRYLFISVAMLIAFIGGPAAFSDGCDNVDSSDTSKKHTYTLSVTSSSEESVPITGTMVSSGPDQLFEIDAETPYLLEVSGANILIILGSVNAAQNIDFSLSIDGQLSTSGKGNTVYAVGEGTPKPGLLFSSVYQVRPINN